MVKDIQNLLNFIYPQVCFWCDTIKKESICSNCDKEIKKFSKFNIEKFPNGMEHVYLFKYEGKIRQKIIDFKFNEKPYLKNGFAMLFLQNKEMYSYLNKYDIIIPVPIHKYKEKNRGYNQSELIAKQISKSLKNVKLEKNIIKKIVNNKQQSTLNLKDRKENVKNVYKVLDNKKIIGKNIILFDDVYTTGSTINECDKVLKQAGAKKVAAVTIAKD